MTLLLTPPPLAVTVRVRVVRREFGLTVTVRVDCPEPPGMVVGLSEGEIPVVPPLTVNETLELNEPDGVTVTVYVAVAVPEDGRFTVFELGEMARLKLLLEVTTKVADVACTSEPLVPVIGIA